MVEIIPSILTASPQEAKEMLLKADEACGKAQIDIVDGVFAPFKTIDPSAIAGFETNLGLDFHLMTKEPIDWAERALHAGAERIIGQVELMTDQAAFVGKVQEGGTLVGLALDLETPVSRIDKEILTSLDVVLVMSVKAGQGGQSFDDQALKKIKMLKEVKTRDATPFRICVDGGVTQDNIQKIILAGADEVAIGRRLFEGDVRKNIENYAQD